MTSRPDGHSSRHYERQAEATRHRLAHTLDELSDRLTPGQVFDEMLTYAKGGGGTFLRAMSNAARENPVPSLLIGAGCMLFLSEKMGLNRLMPQADGMDGASAGERSYGATAAAASRAQGAVGQAAGAAVSSARSAAESVQSGLRSATEFTGEQASNMAEGVKRSAAAVGETLASTTQHVRETAHDIRDRVAGTGEQMMRGAQDLAGTVQDYSAAMGEQVADTAERTSRQTTQAVREAKDSLMSFVNEQPLVAAAIGVAIGAAIAAMLPSTETEDELMGEASDAVKDAVSGVASDQLGAAKAAATRLAQEAMSAAEREGLTAQAAVDAARKLGEKVTSVVSDAGAAGQSEFQELAGAGAGLGSGSNAGQDQNNKPDFKAR